MNPVWRRKLSEARHRAGMSRREVALRAGLSPETIRGYENGRRHPTCESVTKILTALDATVYEANEILAVFGGNPPPTLFPDDRFPGYFFSIDELQQEVEAARWPEFVLNNANEVVAANVAVQTLWGIDFARERTTRSRAQMNLLSVASQRRFAERILNWDECIGTLAAVFKGRPSRPASLDDPDRYFAEVLAEFANGDPVFLARLIDAWTSAPSREAKVRWRYEVVWNDDNHGPIRFDCTVGTANEPGGLSFNDWYPADSDSWRRLEALKQDGLQNNRTPVILQQSLRRD